MMQKQRILPKVNKLPVFWLLIFALGKFFDATGCTPSNQPDDLPRERAGKIITSTVNHHYLFGTKNANYADGPLAPVIQRLINFSPGFSKKKEDTSDNSAYLFFTQQQHIKPHSFMLFDVKQDNHTRLDIQQDLGAYVQVQLQLGKGQDPDNCLASINIKKDVYYALGHIMYCLLKSYETKKPHQHPQTIASDCSTFSKSNLPKKRKTAHPNKSYISKKTMS